MTVEYVGPDGKVVRLPSPGMFYDCLNEYSTEDLLCEEEKVVGRRETEEDGRVLSMPSPYQWKRMRSE